MRVWLNRKLVHESYEEGGCIHGEDSAPVNLRRGWNELLMKVVDSVWGWKAGVKLATPDGEPLEDIRISPVLAGSVTRATPSVLNRCAVHWPGCG